MILNYLKITNDHIFEILDIHKDHSRGEKSFAPTWSKSQYLEELNKPNNLNGGLFKDNNLIAFCICQRISSDELEILNLAVKKEFLGRGYGKEILKKILEEARNLKIKKIYLEVSEENLKAIKLYLSFKFTEVGKRKAYYSFSGKDAIIMKLDLC